MLNIFALSISIQNRGTQAIHTEGQLKKACMNSAKFPNCNQLQLPTAIEWDCSGSVKYYSRELPPSS